MCRSPKREAVGDAVVTGQRTAQGCAGFIDIPPLPTIVDSVPEGRLTVGATVMGRSSIYASEAKGLCKGADMADDTKLVYVQDLGERGVTKVHTRHGQLAVGKASGQPFAVSNRCRHLGASLGEGTVTENGCLQCPWHGAQYDVTTGKMTRGPQGALFASVRHLVCAITNAVARLKRYPVNE